MKTLSGTFAFIVVAVMAILAVVSFRSFAAGSKQHTVADKKFRLKIGKTLSDYADVRSKDEFIKALDTFPPDQYDIYYIEGTGATPEHYPPLPQHKTGLKTDKVTASEVARNAPQGESVANDPNATHLLTSDNATEIKAVLDTFK
jgi:hypothetical protein